MTSVNVPFRLLRYRRFQNRGSDFAGLLSGGIGSCSVAPFVKYTSSQPSLSMSSNATPPPMVSIKYLFVVGEFS